MTNSSGKRFSILLFCPISCTFIRCCTTSSHLVFTKYLATLFFFAPAICWSSATLHFACLQLFTSLSTSIVSGHTPLYLSWSCANIPISHQISVQDSTYFRFLNESSHFWFLDPYLSFNVDLLRWALRCLQCWLCDCVLFASASPLHRIFTDTRRCHWQSSLAFTQKWVSRFANELLLSRT